MENIAPEMIKEAANMGLSVLLLLGAVFALGSWFSKWVTQLQKDLRETNEKFDKFRDTEAQKTQEVLSACQQTLENTTRIMHECQIAMQDSTAALRENHAFYKSLINPNAKG